MADIELANVANESTVKHVDGYPALADFVSKDPDSESFVFRKFDTLSARKVLYLQSELIALERQQVELDREAFSSADPELLSAMRKWEDFSAKAQSDAEVKKRKELADQIGLTLERYHKALLLQRDIARLERPSTTSVEACRIALLGADGKDPKLGGMAKHMFEDKDDLVALSPPVDRDALSSFIRKHWPFPGKGTTDDDISPIRYFEERYLVLLVNVCSIVIAAALLIGPILALYFVTDPDVSLALVIIFIVLFAVGLSISTGASRDSIFAATAAYAAVLVVFVSGNLGNARNERHSGPNS